MACKQECCSRLCQLALHSNDPYIASLRSLEVGCVPRDLIFCCSREDRRAALSLKDTAVAAAVTLLFVRYCVVRVIIYNLCVVIFMTHGLFDREYNIGIILHYTYPFNEIFSIATMYLSHLTLYNIILTKLFMQSTDFSTVPSGCCSFNRN